MIFVPPLVTALAAAIYATGWVHLSFPISSLLRVVVWGVFTIANWRIPGAKLMLAGLLLNIAAAAANGGLMPVSHAGFIAVTGENADRYIALFPHVRGMLIGPHTKLVPLCDIVVFRHPYALVPSVYSLGDIISSIGGLVAIVTLMRAPLASKQEPALEEA